MNNGDWLGSAVIVVGLSLIGALFTAGVVALFSTFGFNWLTIPLGIGGVLIALLIWTMIIVELRK